MLYITGAGRELSSKDFPPPFPHSLIRIAPPAPHRDNIQVLAYEVSTTKHPSIALRYTRNLAGITGVVTEPEMVSMGIAPSGLGKGVDSYLDAHGYDASSRLHIIYAWRENYGLQDFTTYLCRKGMVKSEVEWLWVLLTEQYE